MRLCGCVRDVGVEEDILDLPTYVCLRPVKVEGDQESNIADEVLEDLVLFSFTLKQNRKDLSRF